MKRLLCLTICVAVLITLCGCGLVADTSELLKTPQLTGEMYAVEKALKENVSGAYTLEYPSLGEKRSAIVLEDLDGDGTKEAIAFYSQADKEEKQMHLSFLVKNSGKYETASDFPITAAGVEKIECCDFNGDGTKEIAAGFEVYGNNEKTLVVFKLQSGRPAELMRAEYTNFLCNDILSNGKNQLIIQKLSQKSMTNTAVVYALSGKSFSKFTSCSLDGNATSVNRMVFAPLSNGKPAIYLDEIKGVGAITEVLLISGGKLVNSLGQQSNGTSKNIRTAGIPFYDIDGDGVLEIPIPADDPSATENGVNHINWYSFDGKSLELKESAFVNVVDGYSIVLPPELYGKIKVTKNSEERKRRVFYKGDDNSEKELFSITVIPDGAESKSENGEVLATKNGESFVIDIKDEGQKAGLGKGKIKKMFKFNDF